MLQIEYPENVHLIRGNHEAADINALFGFRLECIERMVHMLTHYAAFWFFRVLIMIIMTMDTDLTIRERTMEFGHGQDSINFSTTFHLLHSLKRKLSVCTVA